MDHLLGVSENCVVLRLFSVRIGGIFLSLPIPSVHLQQPQDLVNLFTHFIHNLPLR